MCTSPITPTDGITNGDLNLLPPPAPLVAIIINDAGMNNAIMDGNDTDRVFSVTLGCLAIFNNLTIRNGHVGQFRDGGGLIWTHAIPIGSIAIDAGGFCSDDDGNTLNTDQRGFARFVGVLFCDIGAYESGSWNYLPLTMKNH